MSDQDDPARQRLAAGFTSALNRHGYSFQYSAIKQAEALFRQGLQAIDRSNWQLEVVEFPVETRKADTRIDFILRHRDQPPFYLLVECKRANPALAAWCFARAPYTNAYGAQTNGCIMEVLEGYGGGTETYARGSKLFILPPNVSYHIGLEVKTGEPGDDKGLGRGAIEEAATQVLHGLNGMIETLARNAQVLGGGTNTYLLPVIFTTAELWTTDADLSAATLAMGKLTEAQVAARFQKRGWLAYQYPMSPGLKHTLRARTSVANLSELMDTKFVRTIAIVNAAAIEEFLLWSSSLRLG